MDGNDDTLSVEALKKSLDNQFGKDKVDAYVEEVNDESEKKVDEIRIICKDSGNMYSLNKDGTLK